MKIKAKFWLLVFTTTSFAMHFLSFGGCDRFLGDLVGDAIWLRGVD
jgi:hypothetical protein